MSNLPYEKIEGQAYAPNGALSRTAGEGEGSTLIPGDKQPARKAWMAAVAGGVLLAGAFIGALASSPRSSPSPPMNPEAASSSGGLSSKQRKEAASAHPGLCGVSLAAVIAEVCFDDVSATWEGRGAPPTYNMFRNQACFDASKELNAFGAGVQLKHKECFAQACRALFPGDGVVEEWVGITFNS